ncbi:hypothetical protein KJ678_04310 [Patescibacteria group bacterium]|nr:hypothetical protein [Patescibacteria group bacterium]
MKPAIQKILIISFPFIALFLGILAFLEFQAYKPTLALKSEGTVAGEKTIAFALKYPNSQIMSQSILKNSESITQQTTNSPSTVLSYYKNMLTKNGWKLVSPAIYKKGNETITITLTKDSNNITIVNVDYYSAVPTK